jgi:predicted anti-sigma-YlaC factor YlaD
MDHKNVQKLFQDWNEGRVDGATRSLVKRHLDGCAACKRYYETMSLLLEKPDPSVLQLLEPDPFLPGRIRALAASGSATPSHTRRLGFVRASVTAMVFAVAVAGGVILGTGLSNVFTRSYDETAVVKAYSDAFSQSGLADTWEELVASSDEGK